MGNADHVLYWNSLSLLLRQHTSYSLRWNPQPAVVVSDELSASADPPDEPPDDVQLADEVALIAVHLVLVAFPNATVRMG